MTWIDKFVQHINVIFYYLRKKIRYNANLFTKRTTTLDAICDNYIKRAWTDYIDDETKEVFTWDKKPQSFLVKCVNGKGMAVGKKWSEVDYVYIPVFIKELKHWVLAEIDLTEPKINIYDSMASRAHQNKVREVLTIYIIMIPFLLKATTFYQERKEIKKGDFALNFKEDIEVQQNG